MIELQHVTVMLGQENILQDFTLPIEPRETICITGMRGAGKTTVLSLLLGVLKPTKGSVLIDGADFALLPPPVLQLYRRRVGVMFQDRMIIDDRTMFENIAIPLEESGATSTQIAQKIFPLLEALGLTSKAHVLGSSLSPREQTLAAFARAIAHEPMVVLLDEPLLDLPEKDQEMLLGGIRALHKNGATIVIAAQDVAPFAELQARIVHLKAGSIVPDEPLLEPDAQIKPQDHPILKRKEKSTPVQREELPEREAHPHGRKIHITMIKS